MGLNKQRGNMYPFVTHTWNPIRSGKDGCPHQCIYCYMKGRTTGELRLEEKELKTNLGQGNFIFVGSATDMWAEAVPSEWIEKVITRCRKFFDNTYIFQSKNPARFLRFKECFVSFVKNDTYKVILGTTLETHYGDITSPLFSKITKAPSPFHRYLDFTQLKRYKIPRMVSIEPILDFHVFEFLRWLQNIQPRFVSIGADSKGHNLPEPSPEKIKALIEGLREFTEVKIKSNLKRLLKGEIPDGKV